MLFRSQNPGGPNSIADSETETPHSVTEFVSKDIDELLREAEEEDLEGFATYRQEILTALVRLKSIIWYIIEAQLECHAHRDSNATVSIAH